MSKAILVIDTDEIENCNAEVYVYKNNKLYEVYHNVKLQPMPTRKLALFDPNHCDMEEEIKIIYEINGYNRCIDEILEK